MICGNEYQGPGDNSSLDDPYVMFTGRLYNAALVAGIIRVQQGAQCLACTMHAAWRDAALGTPPACMHHVRGLQTLLTCLLPVNAAPLLLQGPCCA